MKINKVILSKRRYENNYIELVYSGKNNIKLEDLLSVETDKQTFYFEVVKIESENKNTIKITAEEIGYWANKMSLDPRVIVEQHALLVEDKNKIEQIRKESKYL